MEFRKGIASPFLLPVVDAPAAALTWAAMPAAVTELFGLTTRRFPVNILGFSRFRIHVDRAVAGHASAVLRAKASTNAGADWSAIETGGALAEPSLAGTGLVTSPWGVVDENCCDANGDCWVALFGAGGNGVASPQLLRAYVEFQ